jgi:transcriptional regulator with XRE-family HTH domain
MPEAMYDFSVLRTLRKRDGLTIADLSSRTGVSPAVISKLERNQTSAELATLFCISRAFGMNTTDLLALAEARTAHRAAESTHTSDAFTFREVRYANARALMGTAKAGGRVSNPEIHQDDFEVCWVLGGRVRVSLPHEQHELATGQCIQFDAILEHTYEVIEDCQVLILHLRKSKRF